MEKNPTNIKKKRRRGIKFSIESDEIANTHKNKDNVNRENDKELDDINANRTEDELIRYETCRNSRINKNTNLVNDNDDPLVVIKKRMMEHPKTRSSLSKFVERTLLQVESHNKSLEKSKMWESFEMDKCRKFK